MCSVHSDCDLTSDGSTDGFTDDGRSSSRKTSLLSSEELLLYAKPFASRRGSTCSIRPDIVPELQIPSNVAINGIRHSGSIEGWKIFKNLEEDVNHYGSLLKSGTDKISDSVCRMLLFPVCPPEEDDLAHEKISLFNAFVRKLLPAFGIFHTSGDMFSQSDNDSNIPKLFSEHSEPETISCEEI